MGPEPLRHSIVWFLEDHGDVVIRVDSPGIAADAAGHSLLCCSGHLSNGSPGTTRALSALLRAPERHAIGTSVLLGQVAKGNHSEPIDRFADLRRSIFGVLLTRYPKGDLLA